MSLLKRAFICVDRNWKKSAILFILIFIITNLMIGATLVLRTTYQTREHFYTRMPNQILVANTSDALPLEALDAIRDLPYVRHSNYILTRRLSSFSLVEFYEEGGLDHINLVGTDFCLEFGLCGFSFRGVSSTTLPEINDGIFELTSGRMFLPEELENLSPVAVISQPLADLNNLVVGDIMTFEVTAGDPRLNFTENVNPFDDLFFGTPIEIEIIGLFEIQQSISPMYESIIRTETYGLIFAPNLLISHVNETNRDLFHEHFTEEEITEMLSDAPSLEIMLNNNLHYAFFYLYDFRDYDAFYEQARRLLPEPAEIGTLEHFGFDGMSRSMGEIQGIINTFLFVSMAACLLVVGLTIMLFFRDRRHEIGIYMSLGQTKLKVLVQLSIEIIFVVIPAFVISFFTGNWVATQLNSWLLDNFLAIDVHVPRETLLVYTNTIIEDTVYSMHQINLDFWTALILFAVLLLIIILATFIPILYLLHLKPKAILEQSRIR